MVRAGVSRPTRLSVRDSASPSTYSITRNATLLVAAVVVDVDHAGVVDRGHGAGLAAEPLGEAGLVQQRRQQDLHRDRTAEHLVGAAPHVAHAAAGDPLVQAVPAAERSLQG